MDVSKVDSKVETYVQVEGLKIDRIVDSHKEGCEQVISDRLLTSYDEIIEQTPINQVQDRKDRELARSIAVSEFAKARVLLTDSAEFSAVDVLGSVAKGFSHYSYACSSSPFQMYYERQEEFDQAEIESVSLAGQVTQDRIAGQATSGLNDPTGYSCEDVINEYDKLVIATDLLSGNSIARTNPLKLQFAVSATFQDIQPIYETEGLKTRYTGWGLLSGIHYRIESQGLPAFLQKTGPQVGLSMNFTTGNADTFDGNIERYGVWGGWQQYFGNNLYISPQVTAAFSSNQLNFGTGIVPPQEYSFNVGGQAYIGLDFDVSWKMRFGVEAGYSFERAIFGQPDYLGHGPSIRLTTQMKD